MSRVVLAAAIVIALSGGQALAAGTYDPGASDTEIKIGNTFPYSGPVSSTSPVAREFAGYFNMINDQGGVNGRKINFISKDDGYSPPKTVELTRGLVEQEQVLLMYGSEGTPTQLAVQPYLNNRKIPQLFVLTGSNSLIDAKKYPWTMGFNSSYGLEGVVWAKYILAEKPNAKIGILYQDDDFGSDHIGPFLEALGDKAKTMVVGKESYAVTDPTVTSQIISLRSAGADTFVLFAQSRAAAQAISVARDQAGPGATIFVPFVSSSKNVLAPVGDEKLTGVLSTANAKDPTDPTFADDPAVKDYLAWVKKYTPQRDWDTDIIGPGGYIQAQAMVEVLKRAGNDVTRANVMKIAGSMDGWSFPLLLPGVTLTTSADNHFPIRTLQMKRFDGTHWVLIGKPIKG